MAVPVEVGGRVKTVAVVGGGLGGSLTAMQLIRLAELVPLNLRVVMYDDRGYNYDRNKEGVGQELAPSVKAAGILTAQQPAGHEAFHELADFFQLAYLEHMVVMRENEELYRPVVVYKGQTSARTSRPKCGGTARNEPIWLKPGTLNKFEGAGEGALFGHAIVETDKLLGRLSEQLTAKGVVRRALAVTRLVPPTQPAHDHSPLDPHHRPDGIDAGEIEGEMEEEGRQWLVEAEDLEGAPLRTRYDAVVVAAGSRALTSPHTSTAPLRHLVADRLQHEPAVGEDKKAGRKGRSVAPGELRCGGEPMVYLCYQVDHLPVEPDNISLPALYLFEGAQGEALEFYFRPDHTLYAHFLADPAQQPALAWDRTPDERKEALRLVAETFWRDVVAQHFPPEIVGPTWDPSRLRMSGLCEYPTLFAGQEPLLPIIGPLYPAPDRVDGLFSLTGLSHRGVQLSTGGAVVVASQTLSYLRGAPVLPTALVVAQLLEVHGTRSDEEGPRPRRDHAAKMYRDKLPPRYHKDLLHSTLIKGVPEHLKVQGHISRTLLDRARPPENRVRSRANVVHQEEEEEEEEEKEEEEEEEEEVHSGPTEDERTLVPFSRRTQLGVLPIARSVRSPAPNKVFAEAYAASLYRVPIPVRLQGVKEEGPPLELEPEVVVEVGGPLGEEKKDERPAKRRRPNPEGPL